MSKRAFDKIRAGLEDARAFLEGAAHTERFCLHAPQSKAIPLIRSKGRHSSTDKLGQQKRER